ncbi:unnamed protein product [Rhizophagus irregularis]|nr:unnamed protein product [Rhizophagus irregularis]
MNARENQISIHITIVRTGRSWRIFFAYIFDRMLSLFSRNVVPNLSSFRWNLGGLNCSYTPSFNHAVKKIQKTLLLRIYRPAVNV